MTEHTPRLRLLPAAAVARAVQGEPCPATVVAQFGPAEGTTIPCRNIAGHKPPHRYTIEWEDEAAR